MNPEEELIQTWHLLGSPATAHYGLCLESARTLQLTFDLGQQIPQCHEQMDRIICQRLSWSSAAASEEGRSFENQVEILKGQRRSKLYDLLILLAQPQALWAPHAGKVML